MPFQCDNVPRVKHAERRNAPLDDYFHDAALIWARDTNDRSVFELWLHVVDHCTRLVEAVRKERPKAVMDDLADTFMWFMSFVAQLHRSDNKIDSLFQIPNTPSDIIWNKYPNLCPSCMEFDIVRTVQGRFYAQTPEEIERAFGKNRTWVEGDVIRRWKRRAGRPQPCNCLSRITFAEERHLVYKDLHDELNDIRLKYAGETRSHKKPGVDDLERMYDAIYGNAYRVFSVQTVAFHLLEEVGEMSKALKDCFTYDAVREPYTEELKKRRIAELEEEIADVFSWMNGLLLKIRRVYYEDAQEYFQSLVPKKPAGVEIRLLFTDEIRMSDIVWAKYGRSPEGEDRPTLWCSGCRSCPCACRRIPMIDWAAVGNGNHSPLVDGTGRTSKQVP